MTNCRNYADLKEWDAVLEKTEEFFVGVRNPGPERKTGR